MANGRRDEECMDPQAAENRDIEPGSQENDRLIKRIADYVNECIHGIEVSPEKVRKKPIKNRYQEKMIDTFQMM